MSCIRKQSIMEPLVDTVDQNQIVTSCELLKVGTWWICYSIMVIISGCYHGAWVFFFNIYSLCHFCRQWTSLRWLQGMFLSQLLSSLLQNVMITFTLLWLTLMSLLPSVISWWASQQVHFYFFLKITGIFVRISVPLELSCLKWQIVWLNPFTKLAAAEFAMCILLACSYKKKLYFHM